MLSFFPRGVLDEILNLFESVSEGFPSYSYSLLIASTEYSIVSCAFWQLLYRLLGELQCIAKPFLVQTICYMHSEKFFYERNLGESS